MALIAPVVTQIESLNGHVNQVVWGPFAGGDTFTPYANAGSADRSIHVFGTFSSTVVTVLGSNEIPAAGAVPTTSLVALHDPSGTAISLAAAGIAQVSEVTQWIAPLATGAGGSALYAIMIARKTL